MRGTIRWAGTVACMTLIGSGAQGAVGLTQGAAQAQPAAPARSSDPLLALYQESKDPDAKETILRVVAERGGERAQELLLKVARQDPDTDVREAAIRHLAERGQTPLLVELFESEKDPAVGETILRHLAERDDEVSRKKIHQVARANPDSDLRETAIRHLAERGHTGVLIELFDAEKDPDIKETILRHLAERGDEVTEKKLLAVARGDADPDLREAAVRHLGERGNALLLIQLFDAEKSPDVKATIVRHLASSSDAKATEKLLAIARSDPDQDVRDVALRILAERAARQ